MKKICILVLAILLLAAGCAKKQVVKEEKYQPIQPWATTPRILDAIDESQKQSAKKAEEALLQKIKPKPRAKVEMSSIEVITADWHDGSLLKRVIGDVKLRFTLREANGVGAEFDKYHVTVACTYTGLLKTSETSKTGTFFFQEPLKINALELKEVFLDLKSWVSKTANSMNKALKLERYSIHLTLTGKDDYENKITIDSESAPL